MKTKLLFLVLGLQATWMVATAVVQETKLARSNTVLLETMVVDPRDYLRGRLCHAKLQNQFDPFVRVSRRKHQSSALWHAGVCPPGTPWSVL